MRGRPPGGGGGGGGGRGGGRGSSSAASAEGSTGNSVSPMSPLIGATKPVASASAVKVEWAANNHRLDKVMLAAVKENNLYMDTLPSKGGKLQKSRAIEKFEEDLFGECRIHGNLKVVLDVGEAIEVSTKRDRSAESDPLMTEIRQRIDEMLVELQKESRLYEGPIGKY